MDVVSHDGKARVLSIHFESFDTFGRDDMDNKIPIGWPGINRYILTDSIGLKTKVAIQMRPAFQKLAVKKARLKSVEK